MIKHRLPAISDHMLGLRLNQLVDKRLVTKHTIEGEKTYELTNDGLSLVAILEDLARWQSQRDGKGESHPGCVTSLPRRN